MAEVVCLVRLFLNRHPRLRLSGAGRDPPGSAPPGNVKLSLGFLLTCLHQDETDEDIERLVDALTTTLVLFPKKAGHSPTACHSGFSNDDFERRHLLQPLLNQYAQDDPTMTNVD